MFTANKLAIETVEETGPQIWRGDVTPSGKPLQYLCLGSDDDPEAKGLYLEYNDQCNACDGRGVQKIDLRGTRLVVHLVNGTSIMAGAVDRLSKERLSRIEVQLDLGMKDRNQLSEKLREVVGDSCCRFQIFLHSFSGNYCTVGGGRFPPPPRARHGLFRVHLEACPVSLG